MATIDISSRTIVVSETQTIIESNAVIGPPGPQGLKGDTGDTTSYPYVASTALGGHRIVCLNASSNLEYASNDNLPSRFTIVGMTTEAVSAGYSINVQRSGELVEPSWNWTLNLPIFLSTNGLLTQTPPSTAGTYSLVVGFPITSTKIYISIQEPIIIT